MQVLQHNGFIDPGLTIKWRITPLSELVIEEPLGLRAVFFPPPANGTHVMRGWSNYRQIGSICRMKEFAFGIFGHTLDLQAKDPQLFHGFCFPEMILPMVKIIDIQFAELQLKIPIQISE